MNQHNRSVIRNATGETRFSQRSRSRKPPTQLQPWGAFWGGLLCWQVLGIMIPLLFTDSPPVYAAIPRQEIELSRRRDESYPTLLRRAEGVARAAAQRAFDGNILVTQVSITIVGNNNGAIAPILRLEVSRQLWQREPDPQRWATYFPTSQFLLGF